MMNTDTIETLKATAPALPPETLAVAKGTDAWGRIQERARMSREDWRLVGEALLIGRRKHKSNQGFGQWCREHGFGNMHPVVRSNAIWLVENWDEVWGVLGANYPDLSDPSDLRQAYLRSRRS